jgi:hypothetical protein
MYEHIEALVEGPYLELFSRAGRNDWDSWGLQTGLFDDGQTETRRRSSYSRPKKSQPGRAAVEDGVPEVHANAKQNQLL